MFTLTYTPEAWQTSDNILPIGQNSYESRPGFFQVVEDNINRAFGWNDAAIMEIFGGIHIWHGYIFERITDSAGKPMTANLCFSGSRFQALQTLGNREERIYIGNGKTIYYLHRNLLENAKEAELPLPDSEQLYECVFFDNEFKDAEEKSYPLPGAKNLATWRNRLWASDGTHIIYHCLNDNPHHWEPLDAIAIQGGNQSEVTGLCPMGNKLIVSTQKSLWQIVGDSPVNWECRSIVNGHGAINSNAMATDGNRLFYLDSQGVYELGRQEPLSEVIQDIFYSPDYDSQLLLDAKGEYLYLLIHNRLFALHTYSGQWGEVVSPYQSEYPIKGLLLMGGYLAFYGDRGLWLQGGKYAPDVWQSGTEQPVQSIIRTWPVQPNAYGQTALNRVYLGVEGSYNGKVSYRVFTDSQSPELVSHSFTPWRQTPPAITINPQQTVYRELSDRVYLEAPLEVAWRQFEHQIELTGYARLHSFEPVYQFGKRAS